MARAYTIATAALALDTPIKWLDNVLSHHRVLGVVQERQGVARKLTVDGLVVLALIVTLVQELALPTQSAIKIAEEIAQNAGRFRSPQGLNIAVDLLAFRTALLSRLERAVEIAPAPKRGRPPSNKTGRLA
jgi:hypothetical protein